MRVRDWKASFLAVGTAALSLGLAGPQTLQADPARPDDGTVRRAIEGALIGAPGVPFNGLGVSVVDGIAGLTGVAETLLGREQAACLARTIEGVRGVVNRLDVEPVSRSDADVRADITRGLLLDPATESYEVEVAVRGGVATLGGEVHSGVEKRIAVRVASGVSGVRDVQDRMRVRPKPFRSDGDIAADVKARLAWDPHVPQHIEIAVENGRVTLVGEVKSALQRERAAADARVAGVREVDASGLRVPNWTLDDPQRDRPARRTDAEIRRDVADTFRYDPRLEPFGLEVQAAGGAVTLRGLVESRQARSAAEEDALNTLGVLAVHNQLRVRGEKQSGEPPNVIGDSSASVSPCTLRAPGGVPRSAGPAGVFP